MRILHIVRGLEPELGGPPRFVVALTSALKDIGVESTIFATAPPEDIELTIQAPDANVQLFKRGRLANYWPGHSPAMRRELDRKVNQFDVVNIHELWHHPNYVATRAAVRNNIPVVVSPHGGYNPLALEKGRLKKRVYSAMFERHSTARSTHFHALTEREAQDTADNVKGIDIQVISAGVNPAEFRILPDPDDFDQIHPEVKGKKVILFMGRLNRVKGLDILVEGFKIATNGRNDLHLVIAGPDEGYGATVRGLVSTASLESKVSFIGSIYGEAKQTALSRADVFALMSYGEGFSMAILEALAASLPVIISKECNFPAIRDSGAGMEINLDPKEFAKSLTQVLDDPSLLRKMEGKARDLAAGPYSRDTLGASFQKLYRGIIRS